MRSRRSRRNSITLVMTCFPPELLDLFVNISRSPCKYKERLELLGSDTNFAAGAGLRSRLNTSFFQTADWMRNRCE